MDIDEAMVKKILAEVMNKVQKGSCAAVTGISGEFDTVEQAVTAARQAQVISRNMTLEQREKMICAMRQTTEEHAEMLADMAVKETGMGRIADKTIKNQMAARKSPGTEDLHAEVYTGDHGMTLVERGPFGVIGAITPTTNPSETIICNGIAMIAAGNSVVFSPHPAAVQTSKKTIQLLNEAIIKAGGPANLLVTLTQPSIEAATEMMHHPGIDLLVATGGPGVVKAVLSSGKKAIGAGAGNPPAVVDETADIQKAAQDIVAGCSFDNNLPCIAEKEVIVVDSVADQLLSFMQQYGAFFIQGEDINRLRDVIMVKNDNRSYSINKNYVGRDPLVLLKKIGIDAPPDTRVILCEAAIDHPFVQEELMMPVLAVVRVNDIDEAIRLAVKVEHHNRHTAIMHSKNVDHLTRLAKAIETTIFIKNAPSYAGIGVGGEGHITFTIAGPTGEGLTSARTFTRQRRCVLVDGFSIV
jgi:propionaldehyde dehydrogenase